ncbi:DHA2 family efflux MFS transporter permease subunit [Streptomyces sp. NPDC050658]|uniref:DHA2 family efflux MFS transporter permease subunit n=1 Tax=unclassified Streptomyces TaxID=2593676 RepID=UPI00342952B4
MATNCSPTYPGSAGPGAGGDASVPAARIPRSLSVLVGAVSLGAVLAMLDATIVAVGIGAMGRGLNASLTTIQWVTTSYMLAFAMVMPLLGWAVGRFGARRTWLTSLTVFVVGSALCALAWSAGSLIAFRVVQGLGGGLLLPLSQTILARAAGPQLRGRVLGLAAVPAMLAPVFGPVAGGVIIDNLDWPWLFYVNLPLGVIALVLAMRLLPRDEAVSRAPLDVLALILLSPGLAVLTLGFMQVGATGSLSSFGARVEIAVGGLMLVAFVVHALRRRTAPLVDLRLFRRSGLAASAVASFLLAASLFGSMLLLPLYHQLLLGQDAMTAGLSLVPQGLGALLAVSYAGRLTDRYGAGKVVPAGVVLVLVGTLPYAFAGAGMSPYCSAAGLLVRGIGLGASFTPALVAAYHGLGKEQIAGATSIVNIAQRVGGSVGTALLSVVLHRRLEQSVGPDAVLNPMRAGRSAAAQQLVPVFGTAFWWMLGFSALALLPALVLPRRSAE